MKQFQNVLSIGILFIIVGIILLVVGSGVGESVFFVFPFFIFSGSDPISIFIILGFMLLVVIFMLRSTSDVMYQPDLESKSYGGERCVFCSSPLPINASFCPTCGNAKSDDFMDNN